MERTELRQILTAILEDEKGEKVESLEDGLSLREGLGLDSVDLITMVMSIQNRFHIDLSTEELEQLHKVGDLLNLIQAKLPGKAAA